MLISRKQFNTFWSLWSQIERQAKWSKSESERERKTMLESIGFSSLTLVDKKDGCDSLFAECGKRLQNLSKTAETLPAKTVHLDAGHGSVVREDTAGQRRRFYFKIREHLNHLGGDAYLKRLGPQRFGLLDGWKTVEDLPTKDLHELLMTLAARRHSLRSRQSAASLDSEEEFPDDVEFIPVPDAELENCPF
jgi:hypothetical protein